MKKLSVITIDFWNTLLSNLGSERRQQLRELALKEVLIRENVPFDERNFSTAFDAVLEQFKSIWFTEHRTLLTHEITALLLQQFNCTPTKESLDYLTHNFSVGVVQDPPELLPQVEKSLEILSKDFSLGVVSDTYFSPGKQLREVLKHHDIMRYFTSFSFSDETGVSKPHQKAFTVVLNNFNSTVNESLHIGDIRKTDILGANVLQMDSILYTGNPTPFTTSLDDTSIIPTYECTSWDDIVSTIYQQYSPK